MKHILPLLITVFIYSTTAFSQTAQITGTIRDADTKDQLSGASIKFDKSRGAISSASGQFTLSIPAGEHELAISFVGYKSDKRTVILKEGEKLQLEVLLRPSVFQMNQVVTVSQYKKNSSKETVLIEVIGKSQIKNTNSNDLGEAVSKTSGVLIQDGQISIRGGSSFSYGVGTRTAVLSDGLSLMSADRGEAQGKMVPLENVKQIEVVKGASSVVYGSSALNGVVNVITEWPTDNDPKTEVETNVGVFDNPNDLRMKWWDVPPFFGSVNVNHKRRIKDVQFVCGGNIFYDKSYLQTNDGWRIRAFFKTRYIHPKITGLSFGINAEGFVERNELFFISRDLDSLALVPAVASTDNHYKILVDPHLTYYNSKGHNFKSNLRYLNISRKGAGADINAISHVVSMDNQYQYHFKKDLFVITAGIPFTVGVSQSNLYEGVYTNFNAAIYTQAEINYKILSFQAGVRYEVAGVDSQIVLGKPIFRSGINIQASKSTFIRASWGQGYRIPTIAEKYLAEPFTGTLLIVPNDTLKEESAWSFELGLRQGFQIKEWKAFIDASFFWQEYKNYIEYQLGIWPNQWNNGTPIFPDSLEFQFGAPNSVLGLKPLNIENARIAGYEIGVGTSGKIGPVGLQISGGYSYNFPSRKDNDTGSNRYTTGEFLRDVFKFAGKRVGPEDTANLLYYRIRHLVRADIELSYWKCYVGASFYYGSIPELIPPFFQAASNLIFQDPEALNKYVAQHAKGDFYADIRAGIKINDRFSMGFIVKNIGNRFYSLRPGRPEPLRNFTMQFRYNF